jgi:endonuclease YncB( thermonuclease family)
MLTALLLAAAASVPSGNVFPCTPTAVYDGDGPIWCKEGAKIRLQGIAAREMNGECRPGHPCPSASPIVARDTLVRFLGGPKGVIKKTGHILVKAPTMRCTSHGNARGERTAANCTLPGVGDLSCAMVRTGTVARWTRYGGDSLCR